VTEPQHEGDDRFDTARITAAVDALAEKHTGREDVFRSAMAKLLKAEMVEARAVGGRRCCSGIVTAGAAPSGCVSCRTKSSASCSPPPPAISIIRRFRPAPSAWPWVATGGYGRGLMAPESDIDLLFILPYKQTAWGEQVAEVILYCLLDMGLKVGHATRSVDESVRQARGDMTIRTAILETRFLTGDQPLLR